MNAILEPPAAAAAEAPPTRSPGLVLAERFTQNYTADSYFRDLFPALHFDERGLARVASVLGYLHALDTVKHPAAPKLADDFYHELHWLGHYGGTARHRVPYGCEGNSREIEVPRYIVLLTDDGGLHSFALQWFLYLEDPADYTLKTSKLPRTDFNVWKAPYGYSFNGGLIYHGPGRRNEPFAVSLTETRRWSVHT